MFNLDSSSLSVNDLDIPFRSRQSKRARRLRLVVTASGIELVLPAGVSGAVVERFIESRKTWLYETYRDISERVNDFGGPERWISGARIPFRGEQKILNVQTTEQSTIQVAYREGLGFEVNIPHTITPQRHEQVVKVTMINWLKGHARRDVEACAEYYSRQLKRFPRRVRIKEQKNLWGSCGKNDEININWRLIFAPPAVLEYVVIHELCHLFHRNHSRVFWQLVQNHCPDYQTQRNWLKQNGAALLWDV